MLIFLQTKNDKLNSIFQYPLVGPTIIFLISLLPVPVLFILNGLYAFTSNDQIERYNALVTGAWNVLLAFKLDIKIGVLFIPCWILFSVIGLLRAFKILEI